MNNDATGFELTDLATPRLRLRKIALTDAAQLVVLRSDDRVNRYLDRPAKTSPAEALQFINSILTGKAYYWIICFKDEPKLIGTICLWNLDRKNSVVETGYELLPEYHGKGLMAEALQAVIAYNAERLQFDTIIATTHSENMASIKLLENNGFKRDNTREKQFHTEGGALNVELYSLAKS